ncbi:MAG: UvrD-helicase domain-containing protein [Bacilli bacterium]|nr:UvrD-helicase domain-containing protein [Bacilli bacterium]
MFDKLLKKNNSNILKLIKIIYLIYEEELSSSYIIDFNDLINSSIDLINKYGFKRYYKYIIIDEYQDISINRYKLIKLIKESCNSKIFAVGDDYQSIYRFTGSSINMITSFKKYFGYTKTIKIINTYRNSYELNLLATKFISKNKNQINKSINSSKRLSKPIKIIYYNKNMNIKLKKLLNKLDEKVLILSRNSYDIKRLEDDELKVFDDKIIYNDKEYDYKTIHKSKGLEEENVIILNLENSIYGFPNKRKDITEIILEKEKYKFEEERRLFYVALTRSKNNVYLFCSFNNPSIFVKEIIRKSKKYIEVLDL